MTVAKGTMRDLENPAREEQSLVTTEEEKQRNGHVEADVLEDVEPEEDKEDEEEVYDEHESPKTLKIRNKAGEVLTFTAVEMTEKKMIEWMKIVAARVKKKTGETEDDFVKFLAGLITRGVKGPDNQYVPYPVVKAWGHRVRFKAFELVQEVNGLSDKAVKKEGKG